MRNKILGNYWFWVIMLFLSILLDDVLNLNLVVYFIAGFGITFISKTLSIQFGGE